MTQPAHFICIYVHTTSDVPLTWSVGVHYQIVNVCTEKKAFLFILTKYGPASGSLPVEAAQRRGFQCQSSETHNERALLSYLASFSHINPACSCCLQLRSMTQLFIFNHVHLFQCNLLFCRHHHSVTAAIFSDLWPNIELNIEYLLIHFCYWWCMICFPVNC